MDFLITSSTISREVDATAGGTGVDNRGIEVASVINVSQGSGARC